MKIRLAIFSIATLLLAALIIPGCTSDQTTTVTETSTITTSATASEPAIEPTTSQPTEWWDDMGEPQYGGTITLPSVDVHTNFDAHTGKTAGGMSVPFQYDGLFFLDWTANPDIYPFKGEFVGLDGYQSMLAESWEQPNPNTYICLLYTSPSPRDRTRSRMPSSA